MRTAEIVILGAGVMGASIAWHLAKKGVRDVLVLDREGGPGRGTTGRATGGYRAQFGTEINIRLSLLSRAKLRTFREEVGVECGYRPAGYLFMATDLAQMAELRAGVALQRRCGLAEVAEVSVDDIRTINPAVDTDGIVGGTHCPTDGFIRPLDILRGYYADAVRLGVEFAFDCGAVTPLVEESGGKRRVHGVVTAHGRIDTRLVINAAGPWAGVVGPAGVVDVPVRPERRQVAITLPFAELPDDMPLTVDCGSGFHLRVREGRVFLLKPNETCHADPFDATFDAGWIDDMMVSARRRLPGLDRVRIDRGACRAGLYEMSPDRHAVVGEATGIEGLYLACGNSGHGVMHAPALGQLVAERLVDGHAKTIDIGPLRPSRFAEGAAHPLFGVI